ncbi:hypothetical protein, partial [Bellilinea sp.]|uniref:hypothetical protein n=1 Tax=Bellilinea sp. TaxID=2838785 RepID=UPI002ADD6F7B
MSCPLRPLSLLLLLLLTACLPSAPKQPPTLTPPPPTPTLTAAPPPTLTPSPSPTPARHFQPAGQTTLPDAQRLIWANDYPAVAVLGSQNVTLLSVPDLQPLFSYNDPAL